MKRFCKRNERNLSNPTLCSMTSTWTLDASPFQPSTHIAHATCAAQR